MNEHEEDTKELLNETYTMCIVSLEDVQKERADLTQQYIIVINLLTRRFLKNKNLSSAISYYDSLMAQFFSETEFEENIYNRMLEYFKNFENLTDCQDCKTLSAMKDILMEFDSKVDRRFLEAEDILEYYTDIIASGILTDKNYYHRGLSQVTNEDAKQTILAKIPKGECHV